MRLKQEGRTVIHGVWQVISAFREHLNSRSVWEMKISFWWEEPGMWCVYICMHHACMYVMA